MKILRRLWGITKYEYRLTVWRVHNLEYRRTSHVAFIAAILLTILAPIVSYLNVQERYKLQAESQALMGQTFPALTAKLGYDKQSSAWQFNAKSEDKSIPGQLVSQVGGAGKGDDSLYSLKFPDNSSKGITYTDNQSQLSITLTPEFGTMAGRNESGRMIYPTSDGHAQLVYTPMNNGLKEDVILGSAPGDELHYDYKLDLPSDLTARMNDDGSIGIYSADRALFGNIQFGSDNDRAKIEDARKNAARDTLMFDIPAPTIKQSAGRGGTGAKTWFSLMNGVLTLNATGLSKLNYPVSVDPSVVITSSSDFTSGNNEGNIDFPSGQINRGALTGGNVGNYVSGSYSSSWTSATTFSNGPVLSGGRSGAGTVAYNGYMYIIGGNGSVGRTYDVQCSPISSSDGSLGTWHTSTNTMIDSSGTTNTGMNRFGYTIYNGYVYIGGGLTNSGFQNAVSFAQLIGGTNCIGAFANTTAFSTARAVPSMVAYNGYMYMGGGANSGGTPLTDLQYAPINADGTLGSWSTSGVSGLTAQGSGLVAYNGTLYGVNGFTGSSYTLTIRSLPINADGSLGTSLQTAGTTAGSGVGSLYPGVAIYDGYMYISGGYTGSVDVNVSVYLSIAANGSLGPAIVNSSALTTARDLAGMVAYNGYVYVLGGETSPSSPAYLTDTQYAKIDGPGQLTNMTATSAMASGTGTNGVSAGITGAYAMAYNGYLYEFGGYYNSDYQSKVLSAPISAGGTLGSWTVTNPLTAAKGGYAFAYYNGCVYLIDGYTTGGMGTATTYYTCFPDTGNTLTWHTGTATTNAANNHAAVAYDGYIYMMGQNGGGAATAFQSIALNSDGSMGAGWTNLNTNVLDSTHAVVQEQLVAWNGYLYVMGGINGGSYKNYVDYAPISGGAITGAWTYTDSASGGSGNVLNETRTNFWGGMINGYLYAVGGETSSSTDSSTAEYTLLDPSTGAPGPWTKTAQFTISGVAQTDKNFGFAVSNGFAYLISGTEAGSRQRVTYMLTINNGGAPSIGSWATNGTSIAGAFPNGWAYGQLYASDGYLYAIGGFSNTGGANAATYSAPVNADGSVGGWTSTSTPLSIARYNFAFAAANGYLYVAGGYSTAGAYQNVVEYAQVLPNGGLSNWTQSANLMTQSVTGVVGAAWNNRLYLIGGQTSSAIQTTVESATIDPSTGAVGTWTTSGMTALPTATYIGQGFAINGYLYYVAGLTGAGNSDDVLSAPINPSTGAVGSWTLVSAVPGARIHFALTVSNGYVFMYGGAGTVGFADIQEAAILPNGRLGDWENSLGNAGFTTGRDANEGYIYNGYVYTIGGFKSATSTYYNDVQYAPLAVSSRSGMYSHLITLSGSYSLTSLSANGTIPYIQSSSALSNGLLALTYESAGGGGVTFGSTANASGITPPSTVCTTGTAQYVWVSLILDDTMTAIFPDVSSPTANATDITLSYSMKHPTPDIRLYQGKYFDNQTLQPLDTCGP